MGIGIRHRNRTFETAEDSEQETESKDIISRVD